MKFVGLHAHSLSIGDSIGYPIDHFKFVVENAESESGALAITDHGTAISYGYILQAYNEFKKKGIKFKPLFGCELYTHPNLDEWKKHKEEAAEKKKDESDTDLVVENESETKDKTKWYNPVNRRHHLVVIAQNKIGLSNLNKIISESYMNGFYRYPRADFRFIQEHNEGLIISSACLGGPASFLILREIANGEDAVFKALDLELKPLYDSFGPERAYLELQFNKIPEQKIVNDILVKYSKRTGYKLIATADSHYARPEWWLDREIYKMLAQQSKGWKTSKEDLPQSIEDLKCELYPKNGQQMYDSYLKCNPELDASLVKEAIERTYDIAHDLCEMIVPDGKFKLPIRNISSSIEDKLREESFKALKSKKLDQNPIYIERLNKELDIICKKGFANYFLVLKEALSEIQKEYLTGAGRGSGAGSLTCYLLEITKLDPIKHNLLFERFLSENRNESPDIDCLDSRMIIQTEKGFSSLKDIDVSDHIVYDGKKYAVVTKKIRKKRENEKIYSILIDVQGTFGAVIASENHKFISIDGEVIKSNQLEIGTILKSKNNAIVSMIHEIEYFDGELIDICIEEISIYNLFPFPVAMFDDFYICITNYDTDAEEEIYVKTGKFSNQIGPFKI